MSTKDKGRKTYILSIEHIEGEDACEYIKEEIICKDDKPSWKYGELELEDYFNDIDISSLDCCVVGKA